MARVAAYLRRSSPGEEDANYSIQNQSDDVHAWAEKNGHTVTDTYSDPGGKSYTLQRPIFQQMLADARQGKFDIVCVGRYDRFSRIQIQQSVAIYQFDECGVTVVSATQPVPDGAIGQMLRGGYAFAAEMELENIRARTYAGKKARVHSGKLYPTARAKYGYVFADPNKERYEPHPETADVVRRIFALAAAGTSVRRIRDTLNAEGVPTPSQVAAREGRGGAYHTAVNGWSTKTIHHILSDEAYAGQMRGFQWEAEMRRRKDPLTGEMRQVRRVVKRSADDARTFRYGADVCPALVDAETFQAVQEQLKRNKEESARNLKHPEDVLLRSGIARCAYCGRALSVRFVASRQEHFYYCAAKNQRQGVCSAPSQLLIKAETLDTAGWEWFMRQLLRPEKLREMYEVYTRDADIVASAQTSELKATRAAMTEAQEQENSYLAAVGSAKTDAMRERFVGLAEEAHSRLLDLAETLEALEAQTFNQKQHRALLDTFAGASGRAAQRLEHASNADRRQALRIFQVQARLWVKGHKPRYGFTWLGGIDPESDVSVTNDVQYLLAH
jgi:site-specific DNA recombinase